MYSTTPEGDSVPLAGLDCVILSFCIPRLTIYRTVCCCHLLLLPEPPYRQLEHAACVLIDG
jgi:hypothetical protein